MAVVDDSALAFGDFIAVAGLLLALLGPISLALYRTRKRLFLLVDELESWRAEAARLHALMSLMAASRARGLVATSACIDATAGIVHRILSNRSDEVDTTQEIHNLRLTRRGIERAAAEARLFGSDNRIAERSALQQLMFQLGDEATVDLCLAMSKCGGTPTMSAAELEQAARELTRRLAR